MECSLQQQNDYFKNLSIEDKVTNIKQRIHDLQLALQLRSKLDNVKSDQLQQPTKSHYQQSSNRVEQSNDVSPSQRANELDNLRAKLIQKPTSPL